MKTKAFSDEETRKCIVITLWKEYETKKKIRIKPYIERKLRSFMVKFPIVI